tara:strand:- start:2973 stop:3227 length:255 start_codon:yes stop_codon:yes gene_type:complete
MGLLDWFLDSGTESNSSDDANPLVNTDGTPMMPDTMFDVEGKPFGQSDIDDSMSSGCFDSFTDSFDSTMDSGFDDSFSSMDDDW